jgi:hypothetical protein
MPCPAFQERKVPLALSLLLAKPRDFPARPLLPDYAHSVALIPQHYSMKGSITHFVRPTGCAITRMRSACKNTCATPPPHCPLKSGILGYQTNEPCVRWHVVYGYFSLIQPERCTACRPKCGRQEDKPGYPAQIHVSPTANYDLSPNIESESNCRVQEGSKELRSRHRLTGCGFSMSFRLWWGCERAYRRTKTAFQETYSADLLCNL